MKVQSSKGFLKKADPSRDEVPEAIYTLLGVVLLFGFMTPFLFLIVTGIAGMVALSLAGVFFAVAMAVYSIWMILNS